MTQNAIIEIEGVSKAFGSVTALNGVDATIREGEFFSLLARRAVARPRCCA